MIYRLKRTQGRYHCSAAAGVFQTGHRRRIQCARGFVCAGHRHHRPGQDLCRPQAAQPHQPPRAPSPSGPALACWSGTKKTRPRAPEPSAPPPMTWAEIAAASRTDPMISSLIDCAQTGFCPPADPPRDGKTGEPVYAGGFCAGDRDAVRRLCGQLRPAAPWLPWCMS